MGGGEGSVDGESSGQEANLHCFSHFLQAASILCPSSVAEN